MHKGFAICLTVTVLLAGAAALTAQSPASAVTKVTLTELHCLGCARNVAKKMTAVPGVSQVRADLEAKMLIVVHASGKTPSPRGLWEAVERANHTPVRLEAPAGTYTSKPPS